ncbi:GNAT family N-acetyltransferase [Solilutibacter silvestris]|uniref:GNAT family N-acetyltransferase n=1 Tax=Solilutibacter silvestris TaxID=1645665 RepID=UPI003D3279A4
MTGDVLIRDAVAADAAAIAAIYNVHVRDTIVTFELDEVDTDEMTRRMAQVRDLGLPWLVLEEQGVVIGYAYGGQWKARAAYARTVESSIYLADAACGRGLGRYLYAELIERLRECGIHIVIGGVSLPNAASVALHEGLGFEAIGAFREVGWKLGRWIDVGYWQLRLEDPTVA